MSNILESYNTALLRDLLNKIEVAVSPEKIFLLSACNQNACCESIFLEKPLQYQSTTSYDFLVLVSESSGRKNDELLNIIEHLCSANNLPVTAYVMRIHQFNEWAMNGHPFASKVYHKAFLCYDAHNIPLAIPNEYDESVKGKELLKEFSQHRQLATEFICGAELFTIRKNYALAAFNLHQATEQLYVGIIQYITGLRVQTHNLDKLYRYSKNLLSDITDIFPRNNEEERRLFQLLQKAYIDSRYGDNFYIKYDDLLLLDQRVRKLAEFSQNLQRSTATPV